MRAYNRIELEKVARETCFIRDNLEKVIRLSNILEFLVSNDSLKGKVVLKGGTAINLTMFDMPRLSVDIDLDYCCNSDKDTMMADRAVIGQEILGHMQSNGYTIHPSSKNTHALDSWVFSYLNAGGKNKPTKEYSFERIQNIRFPQIRSALIPVLKKTEKFDFEEAKSNVISFLTTLLILGDAEKKFIDSFNQGEYKPEVLFDDGEIIERIKELPMALWKMNEVE